jgi:hypothetical protein
MKKIILAIIIVMTGSLVGRANTIRGAADTPFNPGVSAAAQLAQVNSERSWGDTIHAGQEASQRQKEEINHINSVDPYRAINGGTNFAGGTGWFEFQGTVISRTGDGVLLRGTWGVITSVHLNSSILSSFFGAAVLSEGLLGEPMPTSLAESLISTAFERALGTQEFLVKNLPPERIQKFVMVHHLPNARPFTTTTYYVMERMAFDAGRQTTSSSTIQVFDYGTPCVKRWSMGEMLSVKESYERPYLNSLKANFKASIEDTITNRIVALMLIGTRYLEGNWVVKNLDKSGEFFTNALVIEPGLPKAEFDAIENLQQIKTSLENDELGAAAENPEALCRLGRHYLYGRVNDGVTKDAYKALALFRRGASAGSTEAANEGSRLLARLKAARDQDERMASLNDPDALFRRGQNYLCGHPEIEMAQDVQKARADFYEGMVHGSPDAAFALSQLDALKN